MWYYNEIKLSNSIALRSEIGFGFDFDNFTVFETNLGKRTFGMAPVIAIEPRWYYNLDKRVSESKTISENSANFFSIKTTYYPDWFMITIPQFDSAEVSPQISVIPTWGIRRNIGKHFDYEAGFGIGYRYNFDFIKDKGSVDVNLHLRIGYRF
ncbi:MAG: Uncharacterised protein [Flavobacterium sp. SCGC AAA160-P02]|nr:MAG: Uncharacterised protein [Flavobacterium sp. SCGC AAA160-P02]